MEHSTWFGHLAIFLTQVLIFGVQLYREARNRRWLLEDLERKHADLKDTIIKNGKTT